MRAILLGSVATCTETSRVRIVPFDLKHDDVAPITALLHAAYGGYASLGLRYSAATQHDARTFERLSAGYGLLARADDGTLLGTVTYYSVASPEETASIPWYRRADVGNFGQFAVAIGLQGGGIGAALLDAVASRARDEGKSELACETNAANQPLLEYYRRRNFREVGRFSWPNDDATCIVLSRKLR